MQSLTLMAGKRSSPLSAISFNLCTPVVVSSLTPLTTAAILVHFLGSTPMESLMVWRTHLNSGLVAMIWSGPSLPGQVSICSVHHQYSARVSPFHAKTVEVPALAIAAAAWSWVLKMLQEHQRTLAPNADKVSMSTPVWMVMCREPLMLRPLKGCEGPYSFRAAIKPGISCSARVSSLRPNSAKPMSFTRESAMLERTLCDASVDDTP